MKTATRKRKKGGGRKLADGRMSRRSLKRHILNWFKYQYEFSVKRFIQKHNISRQTYYRFLASMPAFRDEVYARRIEIKKTHRENMWKMSIWLRDNPEMNISDYLIKDINNLQIIIPNEEIKISNDEVKLP